MLGSSASVSIEELELRAGFYFTVEVFPCIKPPVDLRPIPAGWPAQIRAIIACPYHYTSYCDHDDLFIDGRESTYDYGRELNYLWTFSATPASPIFDDLNGSTANHFFLPRDTMIATSVYLTLTVTNFLGMTETMDWTIVIHTKAKLDVLIFGSLHK